MRRLTVCCLAILLALTNSAESNEVFQFAFLCDSRSDTHIAKCTDSNSGVSSILPILVTDILNRNTSGTIKLVLFPGDLIAGYLKRDAQSVAECNRIMFHKWREVMKPLADSGMQISITAGNHDVAELNEKTIDERCGNSRPYYTSPANFALFTELFSDMIPGKNGPASDLGLTYSFDMAGNHFVVLNAYNLHHHNTFSNETISWLEADLKQAAESGKRIFVTSHSPAFPGGGHMWDSVPFFDPQYGCSNYDPRFGIDQRTERDRFWNILKKYGVIGYFSGHEHNIQVQLVEGVWHVISGGVTEKIYPLNGADTKKKTNTILYDGHPQNQRASINWPWDDTRKPYWGWCLVTVDSNGVRMDVIGSDVQPQKPEDLRILKSFILKSEK